MNATALDMRTNFRSVIKALERNEEVNLTYRGKPLGVIVPSTKAKAKKTDDLRKHSVFGMWKDREDMRDVDAYVRKLREPRYRDL